MVAKKIFSSNVISLIKKGEIGVLPTDTIYGLVGSALNKKAVNCIYKVKKRNSKKPLIILISELDDLKKFKIKISYTDKKILKKIWPGKVSTILPCSCKRFVYLHRGSKALAFRLPANKKLREFIKKTGPIVAPSANLEGRKPAAEIKRAQKYFDNRVAFYIDAGKIISKPSTLIKIERGKIVVLRKGCVAI